MHYSAGVMAGDRALSEAMFERPEMMRDGAEGVGMPVLLPSWSAGPRTAGELREDMRWEDVPGLICGIGRALVDGKVGPHGDELGALPPGDPRRPASPGRPAAPALDLVTKSHSREGARHRVGSVTA